MTVYPLEDGEISKETLTGPEESASLSVKTHTHTGIVKVEMTILSKSMVNKKRKVKFNRHLNSINVRTKLKSCIGAGKRRRINLGDPHSSIGDRSSNAASMFSLL